MIESILGFFRGLFEAYRTWANRQTTKKAEEKSDEAQFHEAVLNLPPTKLPKGYEGETKP